MRWRDCYAPWTFCSPSTTRGQFNRYVSTSACASLFVRVSRQAAHAGCIAVSYANCGASVATGWVQQVAFSPIDACAACGALALRPIIDLVQIVFLHVLGIAAL